MLCLDEIEHQRLLWRIVNRLQRDAVAKGVLRRGGEPVDGNWRLLEVVLSAARERRLYVLLDARKRLEGFVALSTQLEKGAVELEIVAFDAQTPDAGARMLAWLKQAAAASGFAVLGAMFVAGDPWERAGFERESRFGVVCRLI